MRNTHVGLSACVTLAVLGACVAPAVPRAAEPVANAAPAPSAPSASGAPSPDPAATTMPMAATPTLAAIVSTATPSPTTPPLEGTPEAATTSPSAPTSACNDQPPQDFLIRGNFLKAPDGNRAAIQYRTDHYGYFKGFGHPALDARPPSDFLVQTTFMGLPVKMHRKVVPALACVEAEIKRTCADVPYTPHALAGIRYRNTYRGGEVTNHAYGIAIDVDPDLNTCCGCVPPWNDAPRCKRPAKTEYDRMVMPECWVHAFERFGFYWLGHDVLRDTMHYEFLGDPDKIVRDAPAEK